MDKSILMVAFQNLTDFELEENIEEIKNLSLACDIETMDVLTQNLKKKTNHFYIGKGKVEEIKIAVAAQEANIVIFNVGLSPSQIKNLEEEIGCEIVDKNMLILEIFSRRAVTPESKAQVQIAQLKYLLPRMVGSYEHLGRQSGGSGTRNKGIGETKLEVDRRNVGQQIRALEKNLKEYEKTRNVTRSQKAKSDTPLVSLVGYTNAGKSSLMNAFLKDDVEKQVFVKDMLFASLETFSRKIDLGNNHSVILNDTVGFIKDLPHDLVPAFHSTLEEIKDSDLLIHLIDISNPFYKKHIETIDKTLDSLEIGDIPVLKVFNKIDLVENMEGNFGDYASFISIKENKGIDGLVKKIETMLWKEEAMTLKFPYDKMNLVEQVLRRYNTVSQENLDDGVLIKLNAPDEVRKRYAEYLVDGR